MNNLDLLLALKNETELPKFEAAAVVDTFFAEMTDAIAKSDRVEIRGLRTFYVKKYKANTGRNLKTWEQIKTKFKKLPFFKCKKDEKPVKGKNFAKFLAGRL